MITQHPFLQKKDFDIVANRFSKLSIPSIVDNGLIISTINARSALMMVLDILNLNPGDEVLLPAYHCPVMVYPIENIGCKPVFYKINEDTSVNIKSFNSKINPHTKVVIVVHFFGFPANIFEVSFLCETRNIFLIEDCSHCFWGKPDQSPIGTYGDFSISSLWKFFPVYHGGVLKVKNKRHFNKIKQNRNSLFFEIKSAINTIEMGRCTNNKDMLSLLLNLKDKIWKLFKQQRPKSNLPEKSNNNTPDPYSSDNIAATYMINRSPFITKIIFHMVDQDQIIRTRQKNFFSLLNQFKNISNAKPLMTKLPNDVVPYVFPILANDADKLAKRLRLEGINILRFGEFLWDGVEGCCHVTDYYSKHCIQLPVHQSISEKSIIKMVQVIDQYY